MGFQAEPLWLAPGVILTGTTLNAAILGTMLLVGGAAGGAALTAIGRRDKRAEESEPESISHKHKHHHKHTHHKRETTAQVYRYLEQAETLYSRTNWS